MRSRLERFATFVFAAALAGLAVSPAVARDAGPAFVRTPVGTWYATSTITTPDLPVELARIITLHIDRTLLSVDVDDKGAVSEDIPSLLNSALQGVWRRIDRHRFGFTGLFFNYDPVTGVPVSIGRASGTFARADDGRMEGTFTSENFPLDSDPLDPMAEPIEGSFKAGEIVLRRIRVLVDE